MTNSLVHKVSVADRHTVEDVQTLRSILADWCEKDDPLDATYVVELLAEELSDRSVAYSVRIRLAERVDV
jgi:hypothetical protein